MTAAEATRVPNINISLPEELHKRLRIAAVSDDTTVKDLVLAILAEGPRDGPAHEREKGTAAIAKENHPMRLSGGRDGKH